MTPVLLITNKNDITTDFIVKRLKEREIRFYRLNTEEIGLTVGMHFDFRNKIFHLSDHDYKDGIDLLNVRSVYFRRPEIRNSIDGLSQAENRFVAGEISYTLEGLYKILDGAQWINKVSAIRNAENKIYQLRLAEEIGFKIPDSIITTQENKASAFFIRNDRDCIIKPIRTGQVGNEDGEEGVIFTSVVSLNDENLARIRSCPTYLQRNIRKLGDVRVTVVGNNTFAALIHSQESEDSKIDWRKSQVNLKHSEIQLPTIIKDRCIQMVKSLSLKFGAIDFVLDKKGEYTFLEINPNGQWAWIERILGLKISDSIADLMTQNLNHGEN